VEGGGWVSLASVERCVIVEFGPSRSRRFANAVRIAAAASECVELEPGRYRATFRLGEDPVVYKQLGWLLATVRGWRSTDVSDGAAPASAYQARELAWCAASQLEWFGSCQWRFQFGVPPRCGLCPLFNRRKALHDVSGENPLRIEIKLPPQLLARLDGQPPPPVRLELDPDWRCPDGPPEEWGEPAGGEHPN
jgi:hypothetical protein